jgi:hypothetical protein
MCRTGFFIDHNNRPTGKSRGELVARSHILADFADTRARRTPLKPLRREGRMIPAPPVVTTPVHFFRTGGRGCTLGAGPSLRPRCFEGHPSCIIRALSAPRTHGSVHEYRIRTSGSLPETAPFSGPAVAQAPLTPPRRHGDYLGHAHRRPTVPSLVAHLLKGGRCDFPIYHRSRPPSQRRPFICPVWRSLGKFRKRIT